MTRDPMLSETLAEALFGLSRPSPRPVPPHRRRMAGLTAAALALSVMLAPAAPVRAEDNDDLLAALAALAVIGAILGAADSDRNDAAPHPPPPLAPHPQPAPPPPHHVHPRPVHGIPLPAACAIEIERHDHRRIVLYADRCLGRFGLDRLPHHCAREVDFQGRRDWVYGEGCLLQAGYRIQPPLRHEFERPD